MAALDAYEAALAAAESILRMHRPWGSRASGTCVCLRPVVAAEGCSVALNATRYAEHWKARLDYHRPVESPTVLLPLVAARSSEHLWAQSLAS